MKRQWRPVELARFIEKNITLFAWRFKQAFLAEWFGINDSVLRQSLRQIGVNYEAERQALMRRFFRHNHVTMSKEDLCHLLDISDRTYRKLKAELNKSELMEEVAL